MVRISVGELGGYYRHRCTEGHGYFGPIQKQGGNVTLAEHEVEEACQEFTRMLLSDPKTFLEHLNRMLEGQKFRLVLEYQPTEGNKKAS